MPDVEVSAGRTWREQNHDEDEDSSIAEIVQDAKEWWDEVRALDEIERSRPWRIHEQLRAQADAEFERKMELAWKQDDKGA